MATKQANASPADHREELLRKELARIVYVVVRELDPERIVLFGSTIIGTVTETSDIDLLIVRETSARWLDRIKEVILLTRPRAAVDFFVLTPEEWRRKSSEDPFYQQEVLSRGRAVYARP